MIPSAAAYLGFSDRQRYEDAFERWRHQLTDTGYIVADRAQAVIVWMMQTPEGKELVERLAAYWQAHAEGRTP